jgi:CheY-like chemotaxis protein
MTKKILVVDDEPDVASSIKQCLQVARDHVGYEVTAVNSGEEALQLLQKEKFDLVLLDILMPKMLGTEVARRIRENPKTKNQQIAFLTVVEYNKNDERLLKEIKPADYIQKPFKIADIRERVKKMVD